MTTHVASIDDRTAHPHEEGMSRGLAGMVLFIASEVMLFGGLLAGYFYLRSQASTWPPEGTEHELGKALGAGLTAVLVMSSVFAHIGIIGIKNDNRALFKLGIATSIVLGTIFIGGQTYEWLALLDEGLHPDSGVYGSTFYVITGFHGAHVIVGLLMLGVVLLRALWDDFRPRRHLFAETAVLYWHFVDVVWIFVFSILYLSY